VNTRDDPSVLVVDDSATQRTATALHLERLGYQVSTAADGQACLALMAELHPDIVLLDVVMPDLDGWETLERIRDVSDVPVIMLTARGEREDRIRGLRAGADDFLAKPFEPDELDARIQAVLRRSDTARRDALTGLPNRRAFDEHLDSLVARARAGGLGFALVLFDLDGFKAINDTDGHAAGDAVLQTVARVTRAHVRAGEEVFRLGGDEFAVVVVPGGVEAGYLVAERIRAALAAQAGGVPVPSVSAGVAPFVGAVGKAELVEQADRALYAAKRGGKDTTALAGRG
jgi:two-component system cell cycle response regulator